MHMAPRAAAWVAWAVWTCNIPHGIFGQKRADFGPLFFLCQNWLVLSLESEYRELHAAGVIDEAAAARAIAVETGAVFSVSAELRIALYGAVAAIIAGIGLLLKANLYRIGPLSLIIVLAFAAAGCYAVPIRTQLRHETRSAVGDYLLLLGALILSADLGYAETQFHWMDSHWSRHLLILCAAHAITAYVLDSRLVLSLSLTSLAAWFGIEGNVFKILGGGEGLTDTGLRALLCAGTIYAWREAHKRLGALQPFQELFEHFAANLGFWGGIALCLDAGSRAVGVMCVGALAYLSIRHARKGAREIFLIYGVGYGALALLCLEIQLIDYGLPAAVTELATVIGAVTLMWRLHRAMHGTPA
jgi:hypothetical protein